MTNNSNKVSRNTLCPCGSGKKYKYCCYDKTTSDIGKAKKEEIYRKFGHVRPIINADFQGRKFVAVGNELFHSKTWNTFPDFLVDYAFFVLESKWGNEEIKKPFDERHQILKWYDCMCRIQQQHTKGEGIWFKCASSGPLAAFMHLAYDLYTLKHHSALQNEVIRRLKNKHQFQGARFELFVAATCIRSGFDIEYEDETDISKKHPEFRAKHRETGQIILVEAKSRHRPGVLYFPGQKEPDHLIKAGIGRLLSQAIQKAGKHPYVIFIDINLPPSESIFFKKSIFKEIENTINFICGTGKDIKNKYNLIIIMNDPDLFRGENAPHNIRGMLLAKAQNPELIPAYPIAIDEICETIGTYNRIPNFFPKN